MHYSPPQCTRTWWECLPGHTLCLANTRLVPTAASSTPPDWRHQRSSCCHQSGTTVCLCSHNSKAPLPSTLQAENTQSLGVQQRAQHWPSWTPLTALTSTGQSTPGPVSVLLFVATQHFTHFTNQQDQWKHNCQQQQHQHSPMCVPLLLSRSR